MMSIEAMKQALEALDCIYSPLHVREINKVGAAMDVLRQAIEQAEKQEPVAWRYQNGITETEYLVWQKGTGGRNWTPLYAEPLPCPTCQSLARTVMMDQTGKS
jgi:hypothetical protein